MPSIPLLGLRLGPPKTHCVKSLSTNGQTFSTHAHELVAMKRRKAPRCDPLCSGCGGKILARVESYHVIRAPVDHEL